jgi:hypothetical protein
MNVKSKIGLSCSYNRKILFTVSLLFMMTLTVSCLISEFNGVSYFALGAPDKIVGNEMELRDAIDNAPAKKSFTIALDNDITLTNSSLSVSANKDIILTSNKATGYYQLIGTAHETAQFMVGEVSVSTITINGDGVLTLDGVDVTHACDYWGYTVTIKENGQLVLRRGLISSGIGGVCSDGTFLMYDGEISGNFAMNGGGVFNKGIFRMFGGEISGNSAGNGGGGVYNEAGGIFELSGGKISDNTASEGGGVINYGGVTFIEYTFIVDTMPHRKEIAGYNQHSGSFTLSGGVISCNTAWNGGGVSNQGIFIMSDGVISDNTATGSGGGVTNGQSMTVSNFEMLGGEISGNTAGKGGGVYSFFYSIVSLSGSGRISGNAAELGGGVCSDGHFSVSSGGVVSGNTAKYDGGGVYVGNGVFSNTGGVISDNTALNGNDIYTVNSDGSTDGNTDDELTNDSDKPSDGNTDGSSGMDGYPVYVIFFVVLIAGVIAGILFVYFKKRMAPVETKFNPISQNNLEE